MSYIETKTYGREDRKQFLSSEDFVTKTFMFPQSAGTTLDDGRKIVKAGTVYSTSVTTGSGQDAVTTTTVHGVVFDDIDVTDGARDGAILVGGRVYANRLETELDATLTEKLQAMGIFLDTAPAVTREN